MSALLGTGVADAAQLDLEPLPSDAAQLVDVAGKSFADP